MADDLKRKGPEDPKRINVNQTWEVTYWARVLSVSEEKLKEAVANVGVIVSDVKEWLKDN